MRVAVPETVVAAVVVACAMPSAAANIFPRAAAIWVGSAATPGNAAMVVLLIMTALIMAACPFAIKMASNSLEKAAFLAIGLGLATFNYAMAHDTMGKLRDGTAAPVRKLQADSAALKSRIARAETAATKLPQLPPTSAAEVLAADDAVKLAQQIKDQECVKLGDNCRLLRIPELNVAIAARSKVLAARSITEQREAIERERAQAQADLDKLGDVPEHADKSASRLAKGLGHWIDLGSDPDETLIDWLINATAAVVELVGLAGPRMILLAIYGDVERKPRRWVLLRVLWRWTLLLPLWHRTKTENSKPVAPAIEPVAAPPAAPEKAAVAKGAATAAKPKKPSRNKSASVGDAETVRQWFKTRTIPRADSKLKPKETYDTSYRPWCEEENRTPVSFTLFGTTMKGDHEDGGLKVGFERNSSKRDFYLGIALVTGPKLAVNNA